MPTPQPDPIVVGQLLQRGFDMCILRLKSMRFEIEAKFLSDVVQSIDLLKQESQFNLDRAVEAMDLAARRAFIDRIVRDNAEVVTSLFGTPGAEWLRNFQGGVPPAIVGVQAMFALNLVGLCKRQGIPLVEAKVIDKR